MEPVRRPDAEQGGQSPETACLGKHRYETVRQAKSVAKRYGQRTEPYRCPYCRGIHIGTRSKRRILEV